MSTDDTLRELARALFGPGTPIELDNDEAEPEGPAAEWKALTEGLFGRPSPQRPTDPA